MNFNQVTIPAKDIPTACEFYRKMGFVQIVDSPHYARFECPEGTATFSLSLAPEAEKNPTVIYFEHEELDKLVSSLKEKGFEFEQDPTNIGW